MKKRHGCKSALAVLMVCAATAVALPAQTIFRELVSLKRSDGSFPYLMSLVEGIDGSLYGTTEGGGANGDYGTVFKMSTAGTLTTLHSFCAQKNCADGAYPFAGLAQDADGNLYGTTYVDGGNRCNGDSCGSVFKMTPEGKFATLHRFNGTDGYWPYGVLLRATDGNFYGTTIFGGARHCGTVFKMTPAGKLTTLHSFRASSSCIGPKGGLVQASDGNFYGTTYGLGGSGLGTVFKITPEGKLTTLYSFCAQMNCADGASPVAGLIQGTDGNFYGTTTGARLSCNGPGCGTVFKITPRGNLTTLHSFGSNEGSPQAGLIQATDGDFYGTTFYGGYDPRTGQCAVYGCGTVFKVTATGKLTTLHRFKGADGSYPIGGLMQATGGTFYGTTSFGGDLLCKAPLGCGTVFSLSPGQGSFAVVWDTVNSSSGKLPSNLPF